MDTDLHPRDVFESYNEWTEGLTPDQIAELDDALRDTYTFRAARFRLAWIAFGDAVMNALRDQLTTLNAGNPEKEECHDVATDDADGAQEERGDHPRGGAADL